MEGLIYTSRYFRVIATGLIFLINITSSFAGCADTTIGVENKYIIPDSSFTATSHYNSYAPYHARLNGILKGWAPSDPNRADPNQYLQIDLGLPYVICAVATQGCSGDISEWVTEYKISLSMDNINWTPYQENGALKLFVGNTDSSTIKQHNLTQPLARYIRFIPTTYHNYKAMRVGIYGYLKACENFPLGMASGAIQNGRIGASSAQHPAKNARLHYTSGSSWCASTSDSDPYLQIDLGSSHLICAVATQGNIMADQWVKTYQINTSTDGTTWTTYQENNIDRIFYGNVNRTTVVRRILYHSIVTRYLRIVPKTFQTNTPCLRTEIYGYPFQTACSRHSVGIPSAVLVPDHRFTATSTRSDSYLPHKGRLGAASAWATQTNTNSDDYLQVDIGALFYICAVATQGNGYSASEWVTRYKISYSTNNKQWNTYSENGSDKLSGNTDSSTVVTNAVTSPFRAKFVRVIPTDYHNYKTLRVDLKGLPLGCTSSLGLENLQIPDTKITSSGAYLKYTEPHSRLYDRFSWCGLTKPDEYIQVDLGQAKTVTGIATQGNPDFTAWVTSYKVSYSFDNTTWNEYKEGQVVKNLEGNNNRNGVRVNWLRHPTAARYVRITPLNYKGGYCIRFDLYGCDIFINESDLILPSIKGSSSTLTCSVLGEPTPDIQWFNNGTKINGATQSTLQVQFISAEDVVSKYSCTRQDLKTRAVVCNTFYTCRIVNPVHLPSEEMKETTLVKVAVFLYVPKALNVKATPNNRSITLSWTAMTVSDDVGNINSYTIQLYNQSGSIVTHNAHHPTFNYTVKHLKPYTNYSIRMNAISAVGQGLWSSWLNASTLIAEPQGVPTIFGSTPLSSQSIIIHWQYSQLDLLHGPMAGFRIFYKPQRGSQQQIDVGNVDMVTLKNLRKYTKYSISVAVRNTLYVGPTRGATTLRTSEDVPDIGPQNTTATKINDTTFLVTWQPLTTAQSNGVVTKYDIVWSLVVTERRSRRSSQEMLNATTQATQYTLYNLRLCAKYRVSVRAHTSVGPGPKSTINILTSQPGKPTDVQAESQTKTSIEVRWKKPLPISLVVDKYMIEVNGSKAYWSQYSFSKTYTKNGPQTSMVIRGLVPGTSYEFRVTASAACGKSEKSASSRRNTDIDKPVKPQAKSVTQKDKFNVSLWSVDPINGPISSYQVIVIKGKKDASNLPQDIGDYKDGKDPYVTAELKPNEFKSSFPVGDNKKYGKYKNVQLDKGKTYTIAERAITNHQRTIYAGQAAVVATIEVTQAQNGGSPGKGTGISPAGPAAGAVVGVLFILAMVVLIVFIKRRRRKRYSRKESRVPLDDMGDTQSGNVNNAQDNEEVQNIPVTSPAAETSFPSQDDIYDDAIDNEVKPIPVRQYAEYVKSTKATDYARLKEEYKKLQNAYAFPKSVAQKPINKKKNRYGNVIPYDHSRVIIEQTDGNKDSDYINASYITGFDGTKRKYIAAQGPVEQTFADFWQMIWEQNTGTIVMLTNLKELGKTKCHQYWPESSETYRHITVNVHKTEVFPDYTIRTLLLKKTNNDEQRYVLHFQFTVWPDKGVPHYATAVLAFRRKVKAMNPPNSGPIVIHCSAGIGRTGCYIVIDAMLERAKKLRNVEIANYVPKIRRDRINMVQTDEQYVFIHLAILESLTCGNTELQAFKLQATMHKLSTVNLQKNATGYALEFERLNVVTADYAEDECDVGRSEENASKNRYADIVPLNDSRVQLMREDTEKTDYINASFAHAYRERNAFIMTQAPLQNTIEDFWIMVVNYDIRTIVMLNKLEEENEQFPQYWPDKGSEKYGAVTVQIENTQDAGASREIVARSLLVSYKSSSVRVQHLQHLKWANKSIPDKPQTVLELLNEVQQSQRKTNNATPFVVHCSNGVGRSGTLCAISSILERMKQEQVIDVFQVVKCMRSNRPGCVESLTQYSFCYQIIQKYLDSFSDYANFSDC